MINVIIISKIHSRLIRPPRYREIRRRSFSIPGPFSSPPLLGLSIGWKTVDGERWRSKTERKKKWTGRQLLSVDVRAGG